MKIAYIVGSFPHISETFIFNQILGIATRGHVVDIYTTVPNVTNVVPTGVEHSWLLERTKSLYGPRNFLVRLAKAIGLMASEGWRAPQLVWKALNVLRHGRFAMSLGLLIAGLTMYRRQRSGTYDVLHCQFGTFGEVALRLREIGVFSGKLVTSFRGFDATKYLSTHPHAYDELFREGHLFLPVSQSLMDCLLKIGCDRSKVVVLHSGIDCSRFQYIERRHRKGEAMRILTIGRLTEKKGITYAIQAVARVIASGQYLSYVIAGEGPQRVELLRLIEGLGIGEHVQLLGWRTHDQVVDLIEAAHVLLAPSVTAADGDEEGIPNSIKEAMASGLPVVSTNHGGIPELVEDGVSGYLVPQRDDGAIADRLQQLIDHPQSWATMGQAARKRVMAEFDINKLNDELVRLYETLLYSSDKTGMMTRKQASSRIS